MRGELQVRDARASDYDRLLTLLREADGLHAELQPGFFRCGFGEPLSREELKRTLEHRREAMLVAEQDGELVGLARVNVYDTPSGPSLVPRRRAHVDSLVVTYKERRNGVGRRLMEAVGAWAKSLGATQVLLTVWEGNRAARAFYEELGYVQVSAVLAKDV